jgi:hypothetical protein
MRQAKERKQFTLFVSSFFPEVNLLSDTAARAVMSGYPTQGH